MSLKMNPGIQAAREFPQVFTEVLSEAKNILYNHKGNLENLV